MEQAFKLALVTGATSGIGEAFARLLYSQGIKLILTGRNQEKLETLSQELQAETVVADLNDPQGKQAVIAKIHERNPDLIVNNAGLGHYGEAFTTPVSVQMEIFNVNAAALLELTLESVKKWVENHSQGVVLNISSAAAWVPFPLFSVYSATKAFVNQFSLSLDYETRPYGIRILAACPGRVATAFSRRAAHKPTGSTRKSARSMTSEYAAQQLWLQIQKGQTLRIFNSWYRLAIFFAKYLLPTNTVANAMRKQIEHLKAKYKNSES